MWALTVGLAAAGAGAAVVAAPTVWRVPAGGGPAPLEVHRPGWTGRLPLAVAGGAAAAVVGAAVGPHPELAGQLFAAEAGVWLAAVDLRVSRLPADVVYVATAAVLVLLAAAATDDRRPGLFVAAAAGGAALWLVYRLLFQLGGLGRGDVRLAPLLGAVGGWHGQRGWTIALFAPFLLFAAAGGIRWLLRRGSPHAQLPFGPAMALGILAAAAVGP